MERSNFGVFVMVTSMSAAIMVVALLVDGTAKPARAGAFPGNNGHIAFTSDRDGDHEIYKMDANGTDQTNISNNPSHDYAPSWQPLR